MPRTPWRLLRLGVHLSRKLCEIHVVMNAVTALIVAQCITRSLLPLETYLAVMGPLALFTSIATLARDIRRGGAEREFARWFTSPPNADDENHHLPEFNTSRAREPFDPTSVGR